MFRVQDHIACVKGYDHVHIRQRYTLKFESIIFEMMYGLKYIDKQNIAMAKAMAKKTVASDNHNDNDNDNDNNYDHNNNDNYDCRIGPSHFGAPRNLESRLFTSQQRG